MNKALWQKILLVVLILALCIWVTYNYVIKEKLSKISKLKFSIESINKEVGSFSNKDVALDSNLVNKEISKKLGEINKKLPSETELPFIIERFIFESLKDLDIDYTYIRPQTPIKEDIFTRILINIDMNAKFEPFFQYLQRIENMPTTVRIDTLDITKNSEQSQSLIIKLSLSLFAMQGGTPTPTTLETYSTIAQIPSIDPFYENKIKMAEVIEKPLPKFTRKRKIIRAKYKLPTLKGIYQGFSTKAFINDNIYGIGDEVDGFLIEDITDKSILLTKNGRFYTLKLGGK